MRFRIQLIFDFIVVFVDAIHDSDNHVHKVKTQEERSDDEQDLKIDLLGRLALLE
jgi:hypothetical protein